MNKILSVLIFVGIASTSVVHAAGYGVVDLEKVVENSTYLKQQNASLQQTVNPQTTKLEQLGKVWRVFNNVLNKTQIYLKLKSKR